MLVGHSISDAFGRIMAVDRGICDLLHRSEAELIGTSYTDITHPDDVAWNASLVDRLEAIGGPLAIRKRYLRTGASAIWSDVQVSRLGAGPDQGRLVGTIWLVDPKTVKLTPEMLWRSADRKDREIRLRRDELGDDLFTDYAWLILLQLYKAEAEGRCMSFAQICDRTGCREASVGRWLRALEERNLVDRFDSRICAGQLTSTGISKIERMLEGPPKADAVRDADRWVHRASKRLGTTTSGPAGPACGGRTAYRYRRATFLFGRVSGGSSATAMLQA